MDFEVTYTPEQEAFRTEVRAWLADNIPEGLEQPIDPGDLSLEQYQKLRELGRRLGARSWLYPTYPKEYGGGELSVDFVMILEEELDRYSLHLPPYYDSGGRLGSASIFVWGSEEQKHHFLPPSSVANGEPGNSSASPTPAQTWLACKPVPCAMAMNTSSTARRSTLAVCTAAR